MDSHDFVEVKFLIEECVADIVRELHRLGCRSRETQYIWVPGRYDIDGFCRGNHFQTRDREVFTLRLQADGANEALEIRLGDGLVKIKTINAFTGLMKKEVMRLNSETMELDSSAEVTLSDEHVALLKVLRPLRWDEFDYLDRPSPRTPTIR